jgi:protein-S-isoprenylcysteine O-methyltransferase Ste14
MQTVLLDPSLLGQQDPDVNLSLMMTSHQKSRNFALVQIIFLCVFAVIVMFVPGVPLFQGGAASRADGGVLCAAGLVLLLSAFGPLRRAIQIAPEPRPGASLVTTGIYRWLRHPIYTGIVIVTVGLFLRKPTLLIAIAGAGVIVILLVKVRFEETLLLERYPEYSAYRRRTWGVVPFTSL